MLFSDLFNFNSGISSLMITFFQVLFSVHIMGCIWYLVANLTNSEDTWLNRYLSSPKFV